jgi:formylglycine-generating enzyme required for sulfatase activity
VFGDLRRRLVWVKLLLLFGLALAAVSLDAAGHAAPVRPAGAAGYLLAGVLPKNSAEQFELAFWNSIKDSKQASDYEAYLKAYPKGRFAALARARIDQLHASAAQATATPVQPPAPTPAAPKTVETKPAGEAAHAKAGARPQQGKGARQVAAAPSAQPAQAAHGASGASGAMASIKDCDACPVMVALNPAPYTMGSNGSDPSERPAHKVSLHTPFAIGKYEVTVEQWNQCVKANVCPGIPSAADAVLTQPMRDVSWDEAQLYLKWLRTVSGRPYRLPTESEWEYAARGGTTSKYWWGDQMKAGNTSCKGCGLPWMEDRPPPVGSFVANPFGLYDMDGSVWEWVEDCWHPSYKGAPADGSGWAEPNCPSRVIRGGSWREDGSYMLTTTRFKYDASVRQGQNGFRVARSLD